MSLVLTFLLAINQGKVLTFDEDFDFQMKLAGEKRTEVDWLDKARKKDMTEDKLEDTLD